MADETLAIHRRTPKPFRAGQIVNITKWNIGYFKPEDLDDVATYEKFKKYIRSEIDDYTAGFSAKECFDILYGLIDNNKTLEQKDPDLLRQYLRLLVVVKANFFSLIDTPEIEKYLRGSALLGLTMSEEEFPTFRLREKLRLFLKWDIWYLTDQSKKDVRRALVKALEENEEPLGEDAIVLKTDANPVTQTLSNWIKDYLQNNTGSNKGSAIDRITYLNQSLNVKKLDSFQKKLLQKFLELYDWLKTDDLTQQEIEKDPYEDWDKTPQPVVPLSPKMPQAPSTASQPTVQIQPAERKRTLPPPPRPPGGRTLVPPRGQGSPGQVSNDRGVVVPPHPVQKSEVGNQKSEHNAPQPPLNLRGGEGELRPKDELYRATLEELQRMKEEAKAFSVNAAVARGSNKEDGGEVVAGDDQVEQKLHELEKKLEDEQ